MYEDECCVPVTVSDGEGLGLGMRPFRVLHNSGRRRGGLIFDFQTRVPPPCHACLVSDPAGTCARWGSRSLRSGQRCICLSLGVFMIMKFTRVSVSVVCTLVLWAVALVSATDPFRWDSCGTKDDRLRTTALTMSSPDGKWGKGELASIDAKGDCNLNGPLKSGSWAINVYELGNAHPVDVQFKVR